MSRSRTVPTKVVAQKIDETFQAILADNGLALWSSSELLALLNRADLPPETRVANGMTLAMTLGIESPGKHLAKQIKTQEQLEKVLLTMRQAGNKMPSILRKGLKQAGRSLPRKGGPGRQRSLTDQEAATLCDQVARFHRMKYPIKAALKMAADLCPKLFNGKTVGVRTLQTYWVNRDKLPSK